MKLKKIALGLTVSIIGSALMTVSTLSPAQTPKLTEIKVSYQPAVYWALPFYVASEKNWWAELGLKPEFSTFPAGVPQIAASASKSWDVGATGSGPAVLGFVRFGIKTIGMSNDEILKNGSNTDLLNVRDEILGHLNQFTYLLTFK